MIGSHSFSKILKKIKRIVVFLLFTAVTLTFSHAKNETSKNIWEDESLADSIRFKAINNYYTSNTNGDPNFTLTLSKFHYKLAIQKRNRKEEALALNEQAFIFYLLGYKLVEVKRVLQEVMSIYTELDNRNGLASTKNNLAALLQEQGDYQSAINFYTDALHLFKTQNNYMGVADVLNNIAGIYQSVELYDLALPYYEEAIGIYKKAKAESKSGFLWLNTAVIYTKIGNIKAANENFQRAYTLLKAKNDLYYLPEYYYHLADFYKNNDKIQDAGILIEEGIKLLDKTGNLDKIISFKLLKAQLILDTEPALAFQLSQEIKDPILNGNKKSYKSELFKLLYNCYLKQNKLKLAIQMNENYLLYADSILIDKNTTTIISEALKTDYNAKILKNQLEASKKEAQLKLNHLKFVYSLIVTGVLIILILFIYFRYRIKKNQEKRDLLINEIEKLKQKTNTELIVVPNAYKLNRDKIEDSINRKLNETDWMVLTILLEDPTISNKEIADKASMSIDGISSSLRRMYEYFEIKESKYKKISLLLEAVKSSNNP